MQYISTRGEMPETCFSDVLLMGLCPDGGLAVPKSFPQVNSTTLASWQDLSYPDLAYAICRLFIGREDIADADLQGIVTRAYQADKFSHQQHNPHGEAAPTLDSSIVPLRRLDEQLLILGLSNGPTLAFKDLAMQLVGELFEYVLARRDQRLNIVGATSGDTGSAAEVAMLGKSRVNVFMLSPNHRMSAFQQAQMFSIHADNICNISVNGVFDDCQDLVKAIHQDEAFKAQYQIGAVNSINWARILAQTVYYFHAYFSWQKHRGDRTKVSFCVPSGNFGNVYAGFVAKQMGLPITRLIVATNENDVLDQFFKTGVYRIRPSRAVQQTSSPSMDIGKASNFERYIHALLADAPQDKASQNEVLQDKGKSIPALWKQLADTGEFDFSTHKPALEKTGLCSGRSSHADRIATIQQVYQQSQQLIDPHTADGIFVAQKLCSDPDEQIICHETALPAKFAETIEEALNFTPPCPSALVNLESLPQYRHVLDNSVDEIKGLIEQHIALRG